MLVLTDKEIRSRTGLKKALEEGKEIYVVSLKNPPMSRNGIKEVHTKNGKPIGKVRLKHNKVMEVISETTKKEEQG